MRRSAQLLAGGALLFLVGLAGGYAAQHGKGAELPRRVVQTSAGRITLVGDQCCCEFVVEGDILREDLRTPVDCATENRGRCILLDPNRLTPHPCCPGASGDRCGT